MEGCLMQSNGMYKQTDNLLWGRVTLGGTWGHLLKRPWICHQRIMPLSGLGPSAASSCSLRGAPLSDTLSRRSDPKASLLFFGVFFPAIFGSIYNLWLIWIVKICVSIIYQPEFWQCCQNEAAFFFSFLFFLFTHPSSKAFIPSQGGRRREAFILLVSPIMRGQSHYQSPWLQSKGW